MGGLQESAKSRGKRAPSRNGEAIRVALAALLGIALLGLLVVDLSGGDADGRPSGGARSTVVSEFELMQRANTFDHAVYWLGPRPGSARYELELDRDDNVYIRYLSGGSSADPHADPLTVATYPLTDAGAALRRAASAAGRRVSHGEGFETLAPPESNSAYVVLEGEPELQVEIHSPRPGEAARLASSGELSRLR